MQGVALQGTLWLTLLIVANMLTLGSARRLTVMADSDAISL